MSERIVVLGGGYAGVLAALRMGRRLRGRAQVTLVSASDWFVDRIRLHQQVAHNHAARRPLGPLLARAGVELRVGRATGWRPAARTLEVDGRALAYDRIVYAAGSLTDLDRVPGVRGHAFTLDAESAARLAESLPAVARRHGRLLVCGGGLTAIEAATELAEAWPDLRVALVTDGGVGDFLSAPGRAHLSRVLERLGIRRHEHAPVREVGTDQVITDGERLGFEVCLWAGGFIANPLARAAGLPVNDRNQLILDDTLRVAGEPSVFGAGDAVAPGGRALQMACKTAMPMGAHVAEVICTLAAGGTPAPFRFGDSVYCVSLGRKDGLVQFLGSDGAVRDKVWTGRFAAFVKERICQYTKWSLALESRGLLRYRWPRGRALAAREPRRLAA